MNPQSYITGMMDKNRLLTAKNEELLKLSEKKAATERDYKVALAKEIIELKADYPVTLIPKLAERNVAELKYKYDVADGVYRACLESIKDIRGAIDSYRSILAWAKAEMLRAE